MSSGLILTRHAIERYRQFWMLDRPEATDDDARQILEQHIDSAVKVDGKTHRGDHIYSIQALGIEVVTKRDEPDICVTVLPPPEFRGLTPLQAEAVHVSLQERIARVEEIARLRAEAEREAKTAIAAAQSKKERTIAQQKRAEKISSLRHQANIAMAERDILSHTLKTMRMKLAEQTSRQALRIALRLIRQMRTIEAVEVMEQVKGINPHLTSDEFLDD